MTQTLLDLYFQLTSPTQTGGTTAGATQPTRAPTQNISFVYAIVAIVVVGLIIAILLVVVILVVRRRDKPVQ